MNVSCSATTKDVVKLRIENGPLRTAVVALAMTAWFVAFNHCAVAAFIAKPPQASAAHSHCAGHQDPTKKGHGDDLPCCKTLSAIASVVKSLAEYDANSFVAKNYFASDLLILQTQRAVSSSEFNDTGPPDSVSFAESVLQRSILAHAPPVLA